MNKLFPSTFLSVLLISTTAVAGVRFEDELPTLDGLNLEDGIEYPNPPYVSGYEKADGRASVFFVVESESDPDYYFTDYSLDDDGKMVATHYGFGYKIKDDAVKKDGFTNTEDKSGEDVTGLFYQESQGSYGGAINNGENVKLGNIIGDFVENSTDFIWLEDDGGAISNGGVIGDVTGDFFGNFSVGGGAISNGGVIGNIRGNFVGNYLLFRFNPFGGAISNRGGSIGDITGNFIDNHILSEGMGGAIINTVGSIGDIKGDFIGNYVFDNSGGLGGAIVNWGYSTIIPELTATIKSVDGSFIGNYVSSVSSSEFVAGGAIYTNEPMQFVSDGGNNFFHGNYVKNGDEITHNAIYVESYNTSPIGLTFNAVNKGSFIFNDNIDGGTGFLIGVVNPDAYVGFNYTDQYSLSITGDGSGKFFMNNDIINAGDVLVKDSMLVFGEGDYGRGAFVSDPGDAGKGAVTNLILDNGQFYIHNKYIETVKLKNYSSSNGSYLHIDVNKVGGDWVADKLVIDGAISGTTNVVVYDRSAASNLGASVVFAEALNENGSKDAFKVYRVYGSPYKWDAKLNYGGETVGSTWYLVGNNIKNEDAGGVPDPISPPDAPVLPDPGPNPPVNPEVQDYRGLHAASIEQTRSMVNNIRSKVAANKILPDVCKMVVDDGYHGETLYNAWVNPIYHSANIDAHVSMDADIWGLEAGFDLQHDANNKLGVFVSYRKGEYDLSGKGNVYYSTVGSEIDIDSYIGGLYYRSDYRHLWTFATLYGGVQKVDIRTDDGVKSDSDGVQFGGSFETGYLFNLSDTLKLEPSLGVFYTQVDFDDIRDRMGIEARYDTIRQTEVELGFKLEKYFKTENGIAKIYAKPSVLQVMTSGDSVRISGIGKSDTYDDGTLGRLELGGRYAITNKLSTYGYVNYTFGSNYDATSAGVGMNYAW